MVAEAAVGLLPPHNYSASFHTHTHTHTHIIWHHCVAESRTSSYNYHHCRVSCQHGTGGRSANRKTTHSGTSQGRHYSLLFSLLRPPSPFFPLFLIWDILWINPVSCQNGAYNSNLLHIFNNRTRMVRAGTNFHIRLFSTYPCSFVRMPEDCALVCHISPTLLIKGSEVQRLTLMALVK